MGLKQDKIPKQQSTGRSGARSKERRFREGIERRSLTVFMQRLVAPMEMARRRFVGSEGQQPLHENLGLNDAS